MLMDRLSKFGRKGKNKRMLDKKGFDLWADGYDKSVGLSEGDGRYPFAGYRDLLNEIYCRVLSDSAETVLDIGFGTGTLTARLYQQGCRIYGQDFSHRMIQLAKMKMPEAELLQGDFSQGLDERLKQQKYDAIIATYALHHLRDERKIGFIRELRQLLKDGGSIYVGDVAFETRQELESCRERTGADWDEDEFYFVYEELKPYIEDLTFTKFSECAGLLQIRG